MKALPVAVRQKRRTVVDAAMVFVILLLMVQMWLLTATLESFLAGHREAALPGMIVSGILFAACFALYRFVRHVDREPERQETPHGM